jgi:ribosomal protein S18 acetylase RimI-like enzyme
MSKEPRVGLVVIGVDPAFQGKGYGSLLLKEFERRAVEEYSIKNLQLTVLVNNEQAIRAYEKNGWHRESSNGRSLNMIKVID